MKQRTCKFICSVLAPLRLSEFFCLCPFPGGLLFFLYPRYVFGSVLLYYVAFALSGFLLGNVGGYYGGDGLGMETAVQDTVNSRGQTRQQCSLPSSSCIRDPVGVLPRRRLGGVICFVAAFLLCSSIRLRFGFSAGAKKMYAHLDAHCKSCTPTYLTLALVCKVDLLCSLTKEKGEKATASGRKKNNTLSDPYRCTCISHAPLPTQSTEFSVYTP